jgi:hypothetical protein
MEDGDCGARRGAEWKGGAEREGRMRRREAESGRGFAPGSGLFWVVFWVARKTDFGYKWL